jgi:acyl-[acyl-carrier-protein]-phospholipid O-acyltransferase/long-chain-fatty-acid--[acyl-carrier-protein] ligase
VPHLRIEEEIARFVDSDGDGVADHDGPDIRVAVTAVPDPHKGERIIVVHKPLSKSTDEIRDALKAADLPNLWIPAADSFLEVEQIPILGTGKLDLKGLQQLALAHYGAAELQHA